MVVLAIGLIYLDGMDLSSAEQTKTERLALLLLGAIRSTGHRLHRYEGVAGGSITNQKL